MGRQRWRQHRASSCQGGTATGVALSLCCTAAADPEYRVPVADFCRTENLVSGVQPFLVLWPFAREATELRRGCTTRRAAIYDEETNARKYKWTAPRFFLVRRALRCCGQGG
uniref:Putative secreted protein n=1 Tax=Ixodes ricinus TaxID=34613 RepID=A0A6B0UJT5_IXORI